MSACLMSLSSLGLSNKNLSKGLGDFLSVAIAPYDDHYMIGQGYYHLLGIRDGAATDGREDIPYVNQ
ncbi:hypothetical protein AFLA70_309g000921 [Aspergillus flavus AF70]|nr:hypothetical protein AFLA70_309g000921 [Aspergillus flavus AF70]